MPTPIGWNEALDAKPWWQSKTLWVNIIAGAAMVVQSLLGVGLGAEEQGAILAAINIILRLITRSPVSLK